MDVLRCVLSKAAGCAGTAVLGDQESLPVTWLLECRFSVRV